MAGQCRRWGLRPRATSQGRAYSAPVATGALESTRSSPRATRRSRLRGSHRARGVDPVRLPPRALPARPHDRERLDLGRRPARGRCAPRRRRRRARLRGPRRASRRSGAHACSGSRPRCSSSGSGSRACGPPRATTRSSTTTSSATSSSSNTGCSSSRCRCSSGAAATSRSSSERSSSGARSPPASPCCRSSAAGCSRRRTAGWRYPSFLGRHDLAALSALAASLAAARVVAGRREIPGRAALPRRVGRRAARARPRRLRRRRRRVRDRSGGALARGESALPPDRDGGRSRSQRS